MSNDALDTVVDSIKWLGFGIPSREVTHISWGSWENYWLKGAGWETDMLVCRRVMLVHSHYHVHPGRLTWNLQITDFEWKMIFQTSMIMFHVNLQGCKDPYWINDISEMECFKGSTSCGPLAHGSLHWDRWEREFPRVKMEFLNSRSIFFLSANASYSPNKPLCFGVSKILSPSCDQPKGTC